MRDILFRGKRIDNGEWVCGFYTQLPKASLGATIMTNGELCAEDVSDYIIVNISKQHSNFSNAFPLEIVECEKYEVEENTICQYTGLTDKNGRKIFEGDVVKCGGNLVVKWNEKFAGWCLTKDGWLYNHFFGEACDAKDCEVIGNFFDNPELLKGGHRKC